jgi:predicted GIY-YIG superfamily endonuclease
VIEDLTLYSGAKTELRRRVRTHDEKTGDLLLPEELPRVVKLDVANCTVRIH